jgi:mercuric reductase
MELEEVPASLLVIGGNYIGLEQGQLFGRLGAPVTVLEALDRLAPTEEPEVSEVITGVFTDEDITAVTGAQVRSVRPGELTSNSVT